MARFAHHELMAVELFAWALLRWPDLPSELRADFVRTLADEQRHCRLYLDHLASLGSDLAQHRLSNYFWRHVPAIEASPHGVRAFLAAVGLTLEQANLDFSITYRDAFREAGDEEGARILQQVHDDEIAHVSLAASWLRRLGPPGADTIEAYSEAVPFPLSAARAKGRRFDVAGRRAAGLDEPFIEFIRKARSSQEMARSTRKLKLKAAPEKKSSDPCAADSTPAFRGLLLYPNLGAEEMPGKGGVVMTPTTLPSLRLWRLLFARSSEFMIPVSSAETRRAVRSLNDSWWPVELESTADQPAFPWLEYESGVVPWIASARIQANPSYRGQPILGPPPGVVARVHDKAFAVRAARDEELLDKELAQLPLVLDPEVLSHPDEAVRLMSEAIESWPEWAGRNFTLKPRLGTSGRGRVPGVNGKPDCPAVRGALKRMIRKGGAILEPWFDRVEDLSVQLHVSPEGDVTLLGSLEQIVAPSGVYLGHRAEFDSRGRVFSGSPHDESMREAAARLAQLAQAEGFHGPCGVDGFVLRAPDEAGNERNLLRSVVEFNARFTLGTIVIGLIRRALDAVRAETELEPGERQAFYFGLSEPEGGWSENLTAIEGKTKMIALWHGSDACRPAIVFAESRKALDPLVAATQRARKKR